MSCSTLFRELRVFKMSSNNLLFHDVCVSGYQRLLPFNPSTCSDVSALCTPSHSLLWQLHVQRSFCSLWFLLPAGIGWWMAFVLFVFELCSKMYVMILEGESIWGSWKPLEKVLCRVGQAEDGEQPQQGSGSKWLKHRDGWEAQGANRQVSEVTERKILLEQRRLCWVCYNSESKQVDRDLARKSGLAARVTEICS